MLHQTRFTMLEKILINNTIEMIILNNIRMATMIFPSVGKFLRYNKIQYQLDNILQTERESVLIVDHGNIEI